MVSTPSGITRALTDKLTMGARRSGREFLESTRVRTQRGVAQLLARYLVSIEIP